MGRQCREGWRAQVRQPGGCHGGVDVWEESMDSPSCVQCSELPVFLMTLTASTVPGFSPRNSFHKEFSEPKLPVFVLGLFSGVLHKIMCLETQFSFQCLIVKLGFRSRGC